MDDRPSRAHRPTLVGSPIHAHDASALRLAQESLLRHRNKLTYPPFIYNAYYSLGVPRVNVCVPIPELATFTLTKFVITPPTLFLLELVVH